MKREFQRLLKEKGRQTLPNVLLAAAECAPLSKTGGLADVIGTLPKSLAALGADARVITPYHRVTKENFGGMTEHLFSFSVNVGWRSQYVGVEKLLLDGVTIYLIDNEFYFGDKIYRGGSAEGEQYAFFTRAVLGVLPLLDFSPDILHCNDWHTAMLPMLIKTQSPGKQGELKTLLTIHNIAFQGKYDFSFMRDVFGIPDKYFTSEFIELNGSASFLKAGCVFADRLSTVSPSYAEEICYSYYGEGLEGILSARKNDLSGILNGIDKAVFNPRTDPHISHRYDKGHLAGKRSCKESLIFDMGLTSAGPDTPIVAMVTRLTAQKGFDLVMRVLDELTDCGLCFMLLGTGDEEYEDFMRSAEARHRGRVCSYIGYNEALSHRVYAGADMLLMPSRFEPCGLSQMIAMRYGTLPIVRETGGLKDTVRPYNRFTGDGDGFSFANYNAHEMKDAVLRAQEIYENQPETWNGLVRNAMSADFGFARSAEEYVKLYIDLL